MSEYRAPATEADMAHARDLLHPLDEDRPFTYQERMKYTDREFTMIQIIADALAIEREKARAPFLRVAATFEEVARIATGDARSTALGVASKIRQAAEETP